MGRYFKSCSLSKQEHKVLDGLIASDGSIVWSSDYTCRFTCACKHSEFLRLIEKYLPSLKFGNLIHNKNGSYFLSSNSYLELNSLRNRWYPNDKKILPIDFQLTPEALLFWHLGDGHKRKNGGIVLGTYGYTMEDQMRIVKLLSELGFHCGMKKSSGHYYTVVIHSKSLKDFGTYISKCGIDIPNCYKYKFEGIPFGVF